MAIHLSFYPRRSFRTLFERKLREEGPPSTIVRLLTSNHVRDLQVIALYTVILWAIAVVTILIQGAALQAHGSQYMLWHALDMHFVRKIPAKILLAHAMLGGVTAVAGAVLSWTYQTGSKRLGVVDQFACEISAICRTCLVVDLPKATTLMADQPPTSEPRNFSSQEEYTPVCDKVLPDLQPLEVTVVDAVTEFYNYRKAMMDYMRAAFQEVKSPVAYRHLMVTMLYMQFLMYESTRHAIRELVEFEPNREESLINILCCELTVYKFLRGAPDFRDANTKKPDYRASRLELRVDTYASEVPETYCNAVRCKGKGNWERAYTTASELKDRYMEAFGSWPAALT